MICFGCIGRWAVSNSRTSRWEKNSFSINGQLWRIRYVNPFDPCLIDRTGERRVATTDPVTRCVYLSKELNGDFLRTVLTHELGHVTMMSYGLLPAIHSFVKPECWIEAEEWVCNFIADYGNEVFEIANHILNLSEKETFISSLYLPRYSA